MFEDAVVESRKSSGKKTTVLVSTGVHVLVVALLLIAPMLVTEALPVGGGGGGVMLLPGNGGGGGGAAPAPLPKGGPTATQASVVTETVTPVQTVDIVAPEQVERVSVPVSEPTIVLPAAVPNRIAVFSGEPAGVPNGKDGGVAGGDPNGIRGGTPGSFGDQIGIGIGIGGPGPGGPGGKAGPGSGGFGPGRTAALAPPLGGLQSRDEVRPAPAVAAVLLPVALPAAPLPTVVAAPPPPPPPIRIGGEALAAACRKCAPPAYPDIARKVRVQDTVVLSAVVGKDGKVKEVSVVRGHALLQTAAVDAVKNWEYTPQKLNGAPVEVTATISIQFVFK